MKSLVLIFTKRARPYQRTCPPAIQGRPVHSDKRIGHCS